MDPACHYRSFALEHGRCCCSGPVLVFDGKSSARYRVRPAARAVRVRDQPSRFMIEGAISSHPATVLGMLSPHVSHTAVCRICQRLLA